MKLLYRRPVSPAEAKADLLRRLRTLAARCNAHPDDHDATWRLDKISDELAQHHGVSYEEIRAIIASP